MGNTAQLESYRAPATEHVNVNDLLADLELQGIELSKLALDVTGWERVRCDCPECVIRGRTVPLHRVEDCDYAVKRSALVPEAEMIATERVGYPAGDGSRWTAEFCMAMEQLCYNAGLCSNGSEH
jgi:hypothetical protein